MQGAAGQSPRTRGTMSNLKRSEQLERYRVERSIVDLVRDTDGAQRIFRIPRSGHSGFRRIQ
jgi:hypothetical protein